MAAKRYKFGPPGETPPLQKKAIPISKADTQEHFPDCIHQINVRIRSYHVEDLSREITRCSPKDLDKDALIMDPYQKPVEDLVKVKDTGAPLTSPKEVEEARSYFQRKGRTPPAWAPYLTTGDHLPFLFEKTSFINYFGKDVLVLIDIFRPPWKPYYTSDVFFSQWLRALGEKEGVQHLPDTFPQTMYINNVTNLLTKKELVKILEEANSDICVMAPHKIPDWNALKNTSHLKCVFNILNDYNQVKALPPSRAYEIKTIQCYREKGIYNLKLRIDRRVLQ